jgi:Fe2+ or Zn2+ uptake regulation protein
LRTSTGIAWPAADDRALLAEIRSRGLSVTRPRLVVLKVVRTMDTAPSAGRVYERVKRALPGVSRATIYRNLHALASAGLLEDRCIVTAPRLEPTLRPHRRFVCLRCARVFDMPETAAERAWDLPEGFEVIGQRVELYGRCASCEVPSE